MNHLDNTTLNFYLDDALDAKARAHADAHLAACETCQRELAHLRALVSTFETWRNEPIPRDVSRVVVARIAERPLPANVSRWGALVLGAQIIFATLLFVWALPLVLRVLNVLNLAPFPIFDSTSIGVFELGQLPTFDSLRFNDFNFALPLPALGLEIWAALILGGAVVWFVSNRLLLQSLENTREVSQ